MRPQFLEGQPFVIYYPILADAIGDHDDALLVQMILYASDEDTCEALLSYREMASRLRWSERTVRRRCASLKERGILSSRRSGDPGTRNAWMVHTDKLATRTTDMLATRATLTIGQDDQPPGRDGHSTTANMATRSYKKSEESSVVEVSPQPEVVAKMATPPVTQSDFPPFAEAALHNTPEQQAEWSAAWRTVNSIASKADPLLSLTSYLAYRREHKQFVSPYDFTQWFTRDEQTARREAAAAAAETEQPRQWWEEGMAL